MTVIYSDFLHLLDEENLPDPEDEEIFDDFGQTEKTMGTKKLRKLQDKAEKKRQREVRAKVNTKRILKILKYKKLERCMSSF